MAGAGAEPPLPIHHHWRLLRACREGQTEGAGRKGGREEGGKEGGHTVSQHRGELDWSSSDHGEDALRHILLDFSIFCIVTLQVK